MTIQEELLNHFLNLNSEDRHLRFLMTVSDYSIGEFVKNNDLENTIIRKDGNKVIGVGQIGNMGGDMWEISFSVDGEYRGKGLMREMYNELIELAKQRGASKLYVSYDRSNIPVRNFTKKVGFDSQFACPGVVYGTLML